MKFTKNHHMGTFKKYVRSRFPSFDHLPPFSPLLVFEHPRPPKVRSFRLELTLSLSIWISILLKYREKKLIMSTSIFGWTQRVF